MEIRNAGKYAGWYASYMDCDQGEALIDCLQSKIKQQQELLERIASEIELTESPKEESPEVIINSIKYMINQKEEVSAEKGWFKWVI